MGIGKVISGLLSAFRPRRTSLRSPLGNGGRPRNVEQRAMALFLLTYNRRTREVDVDEITDHHEGLARLFEAEQRLRHEPDLEIVMLAAEDEDDLRKTHSRFFESVDELLKLPA